MALCRLIYCCFMLHTVVHNRIDFYPLLFKVWNVVLCLGHPEGRTEVFGKFWFRPCPCALKVIASQQRHIISCVRLIFAHRRSVFCYGWLPPALVNHVGYRQGGVPRYLYIYCSTKWQKWNFEVVF